MMQFGVVGVGAEWERFRLALAKLRRPTRISAVYDPVTARAEQWARSCESEYVTGLRALASRHDVDAILLMDCGWRSRVALDLFADSGKPVLIACWLPASRMTFERLHENAAFAGVPFMPAMWRRFSPAALRVQELFAIELGLPQRITIDLRGRLDERAIPRLAGWLDYCRNFFKVYPETASLVSQPDGSDRVTALRIERPARQSRPAASGQPATVTETLLLLSDEPVDSVRTLLARRLAESATGLPLSLQPDETAQRIAIDCELGQALLTSRHDIEWQRRGEDVIREYLPTERTEEELMLDLFCRRAVGGLIPIADYSDISNAVAMIEAAAEPSSSF